MKTINIPVIGNLIQNDRFDDWWESEKIKIPLFDNLGIKFIVMAGQKDINEDFNKAIDNFLQLKDRQRLEASKYIFKNYREIIEAVGEDEFDFEVTNENDIWKYVHPKEIYVKRRSKDNLVYIQITAECDWEEEHGLQIIYRNGNIISRVSSQDGHLTHTDAYNLLENEDKIC